jgi:Protein kinase domain
MSMTDETWIGQTIDDRYVVRRLIGKGGMGIVYEAEQPSLSRRVAIKFLVADDGALAQRFKREARLASQVVHEHVAQVYDFGRTPEGHDYLVMEYVEGTDLANLLKHDVMLSVDRAARFATSILKGLEAIHALGIIHRDVKPSNVLLTRRGDDAEFVKLGDFGLARGAHDVTLTKTGHIVGTTPFMAPEAFRGHELDHRADLYAVGITLYQMLASKLPFSGATAEIGAAHVFTPPPPLDAQRSELPRWMVDIVERALEKAPEDRFQSARAFITALETHDAGVPDATTLAPPTVAARRQRPKPTIGAPRRRWPWLLAAVAILGGAGTGAYLARSARRVPIATVARDAAVSEPRVVDGGARPVDVSEVVADLPVDGGMTPSGSQRSGKLPTPAAGLRSLCVCIASTGETVPLCARQGPPRCRCQASDGLPLCQAPLVDCDFGDEPKFTAAGLHYQDVCSSLTPNPKRCSDLSWLRFTKDAVQGAACTGIRVNHRYQGKSLIGEGDTVDGTWNCDSCPGANNRTYRGIDGEACTGYHWHTGAPVAGTLQHCDG